MKLSVETYIFRERFDDQTAIQMIKDAGFDAFDYSLYWMSDGKDMLGDDYRERALKLRSLADKIGISCNQAHAPFDFRYCDELNESNMAYCRLVRSIEIASILGAKNIIVHAIKEELPDDVSFEEYNRIFYRSFIPYCEKFNIHISIENIFNWSEDKGIPVLCDPKEHNAFVENLNSSWFNVCVDVGHSAITGYLPQDVLSNIKPNLLKALHIQDNDFHYDQHLLPFEGNINWDAVMTALKQNNYDGDFTFELTGYLRRQETEKLMIALKDAEDVGRKLIASMEV